MSIVQPLSSTLERYGCPQRTTVTEWPLDSGQYTIRVHTLEDEWVETTCARGSTVEAVLSVTDVAVLYPLDRAVRDLVERWADQYHAERVVPQPLRPRYRLGARTGLYESLIGERIGEVEAYVRAGRAHVAIQHGDTDGPVTRYRATGAETLTDLTERAAEGILRY